MKVEEEGVETAHMYTKSFVDTSDDWNFEVVVLVLVVVVAM